MPLKKHIPIRDALEREDLLAHALPGESYRIARILLISAMGESLTDEERELFRSVTGREREPGFQVDEMVWCVGRRGSKTSSAGALMAYVSTLCDHSYHDKGRVVLPVLAGSTTQANVSFQAVLSALEKSPILSKQIESSNSETIRLKNNVDIAVRPASHRLRGISSGLICADEIATWQNSEESKLPDVEILNAVRPALATSGGLLFMYSSPWAKRGALWDSFKRHYGPDGDPSVLVVKADSRTMNPSLPQAVVRRAYDSDPFRASAEYGANFLDGISQLLVAEIVDAAVDTGVFERPFDEKLKYHAFIDAAGGSGQDSMTLCISYAEGKVAVTAKLAEWRPPFSPEAAVVEAVEILQAYKVTAVTGDRWGGEFVREQFKKRGIDYRISPRTSSEIFSDAVPLFNSSCVALLDNKRLTTQLTQLERRTARGGNKPSISHPPGAHDDLAVSVCGAALMAVGKAARPKPTWVGVELLPLDGYQYDSLPPGATRCLV